MQIDAATAMARSAIARASRSVCRASAFAAARALADSALDAETIARKAMAIAAEICVFTNSNLVVESLATGQSG